MQLSQSNVLPISMPSSPDAPVKEPKTKPAPAKPSRPAPAPKPPSENPSECPGGDPATSPCRYQLENFHRAA